MDNKDRFLAFEVQDMNSMAKMIYLYDPDRNAVVMIESTERTTMNMYMVVDKDFPWMCRNAYEYFQCIYKKANSINENSIRFLHWIDPRNLRPFPKTSQ